MKTIHRYARLYKVFALQFLKSLMQSKVDFFIGLFGFLISQASGIIFLLLVFQRIPHLNGYTIEQLIFIYGFAQIPRGIDHLLTDNIWILAMRMVIRGEFDRYLLRPMNLFFQLICDRFQADAIGELLVGIALIIVSIVNGTVQVTPLNILFFIISIFAGALIYTSIKLFFASLAFWIKDSIALLLLIYNFADFAKYPVGIYAKPIQVLLSWIIPFAFVAFYPATFFIKHVNVLNTIGIEVVIAFVFWIIAYKLFLRGTKIYESSGN